MSGKLSLEPSSLQDPIWAFLRVGGGPSYAVDLDRFQPPKPAVFWALPACNQKNAFLGRRGYPLTSSAQAGAVEQFLEQRRGMPIRKEEPN